MHNEHEKRAHSSTHTYRRLASRELKSQKYVCRWIEPISYDVSFYDERNIIKGKWFRKTNSKYFKTNEDEATSKQEREKKRSENSR